MISHKHKVIFIHIPKCAGTSITELLFKDVKLDWKKPNYDIHYGWCPERKIHMQHATPEQMINLGLINEETWNRYFKFTIIRNPWSRALSDYLWIQKDRNVKGKFKDYIKRKGDFLKILNDQTDCYYRGDHLNSQTSYLKNRNLNRINKIIRFENLSNEIPELLSTLGFENNNIPHKNPGKKKYKHYSEFFSQKNKKLVEIKFREDILNLNYSFEDRRSLIHFIKNWYA